MKLATIEHEGRAVGVVVEGDAAYLLPDGHSVLEVIDAGLERALDLGARARRGEAVPFAARRMLKPYTPRAVRDFVAFEEHVIGVRRAIEKSQGVPDAWYDAPAFYFTNPHALVGPGAEVVRPHGCNALDFELEVGVVISGGGTSLTEEAARDTLFGYTIFNDWSARDLQEREMQVGLGPAKGKDFCTSIGPWIVTADEFSDRHDADGFLDLDCTVAVNGERIGGDNLRHMGWTFAGLAAYASRDSILRSGDLLGSGTTGGGGCLAELWGRAGEQVPPPLEPGDVVTMTVDGIGELTNTVVAGEPTPQLTPFRPRR